MSRWVSSVGACALALGLVWLPQRRVRACSCAPDAIVSASVRDGDTGVPTDVSIFVYSGAVNDAPDWLSLATEAGDAVEVDSTYLGGDYAACGGGAWEVKPREPLMPETSYVLTGRSVSGAWPGSVVRFTTGGETSAPPAALPEVELVIGWTMGELSSCGEELRLCVSSDGPADSEILVTGVGNQHVAATRIAGAKGSLGLTHELARNCVTLQSRNAAGALTDPVEVCDIPVIGREAGFVDCDATFAALADGAEPLDLDASNDASTAEDAGRVDAGTADASVVLTQGGTGDGGGRDSSPLAPDATMGCEGGCSADAPGGANTLWLGLTALVLRRRRRSA